MRPWMCPTEACRTVNPAVKSECTACAASKPKLQGWKCTKCATRNHRGVRSCKSCKEPYESSKNFWMCGVCEENNRVDELDDNSRCGYCGYDMAPLHLTEERLAAMNEQREAEFQEQQERFDGVSAKDAEEQFGTAAHGAEDLPGQLRTPAQVSPYARAKLAEQPVIAPFEPKPVQTRHSRLYRKPRSAQSPTADANVVPPGPPGFDWVCREPDCVQINPGDEENCLKCGTHIAPAEWECSQCAALNHLSRSRCFNCHAGIPVSWTCPACQTATSTYDKECRQCHEARPAAEPRDARDVWAAEREAVSSGGGGGGGPSFRKNDWYCASCNGLNFSRRSDCYQCGTVRAPGDSGGAPAGARPPQAFGSDGFDDYSSSSSDRPKRGAEQNNWRCRSCQASNFRTRSDCWQCGMKSADGDEEAPHFDKEGFQDGADSKPAEGRMNVWQKTDDWVCAKCFSNNFRGKSECFKCGASRSLAVAPRRASVRKPVKL